MPEFGRTSPSQRRSSSLSRSSRSWGCSSSDRDRGGGLMLIRPHTLSLITTYRCTAACDHCCFGCTPQVPTSWAIPFTRMLSLIDEAADLGSIRVVVFTGGECFLLGARLNRLIALASAHDLVTRC